MTLDPTAEVSAGISWDTARALAEPTPSEEIKTREGPHGRSLSYVDARYVMRRLDAICGPYWQRDHRAIGDRVSCGIGILIDGQWVWRWDGAGETDIEGEKGAFSDSFKRAAVSWGVARDLYGPTPHEQALAILAPAVVPVQATQTAHSPAAPIYEGSEAQSGDGDECPVHHLPWKLQPAGVSKAGKAYDAFWKCGGKTASGGYCSEKPSKAWAARHEG